jgi:uncharacterized protein YbjT (DUF2867 family)
MRVFITGGTGTIGEAAIRELRRAGHDVMGLSRSEASDAQLRALGATPHRGAVDQPASYLSTAASYDALVHVAFDYGAAAATDRAAIEALLAAPRAPMRRGWSSTLPACRSWGSPLRPRTNLPRQSARSHWSPGARHTNA